jgi:catechol 2,3-dioxygenase
MVIGFSVLTNLANMENHSMSRTAIHPETRIGEVALRVRDLSRSVDFYTKHLGFTVMERAPAQARLGDGDTHILVLREDPQARTMTKTAGLYHFAILVPSRMELARSLRRLIERQTPLQGFADHLVSEAIYLADPDGNGIEIYRDRARDEWPRRNGQLLMATDPLDVHGLLDEISGEDDDWAGLAPGTTIGHIHLQVSDLQPAVDFYHDTIGFDLIMRYGPSAAFLSAGGYHHHVGLNTWAGTGVPPAPPEATGLVWFTIDIPDQESYQELARRLSTRKIATQKQGQGLLIHDPSGIAILLRHRA